MLQVLITNNVASKLGEAGTLEYQLWADDAGSFFVQITKNSDGGTFPECLFNVSKYARKRNSTDLGPLAGVDRDGKEQEVGNNNADGFLRAVLRHLLDGGAAV
jgi:hypothetical protein